MDQPHPVPLKVSWGEFRSRLGGGGGGVGGFVDHTQRCENDDVTAGKRDCLRCNCGGVGANGEKWSNWKTWQPQQHH